MNPATLIVEGTDEAIHALSNLLWLEADSTWKKGESKRRGGFYPISGLSATIADSQNSGQMVVAIREFATECQARNIVFSRFGLTAGLSIGVTVGATEQFVACVDFSTSDLVSLGALGVAISIAAYPTSNEANENSQKA
jgi:hypothetical protein